VRPVLVREGGGHEEGPRNHHHDLLDGLAAPATRARCDTVQAATLGTWPAIPPWTVASPLFVGGAGWLIVAFGMLVKEEYWEFRVIGSGLIV
jgi:hypothetical protein